MLALVALATLPVFGNQFGWDDEEMILDSGVIHDPANLPAIFLHDTMYSVHGDAYGASVQLDTYRPVTMTTFVWDAAISGRTPFSYHLTNFVAHLATVGLVYLLALSLLETRPGTPTEVREAEAAEVDVARRKRAGALDGERRRDRLDRSAPRPRGFLVGSPGAGAEPWAAFAAGFFGLHPLLAEAHVWINGRSDVFAALFGVAAVLAWRRNRLVVASGLLLLGLLSKEVLLTALPALGILAWREREDDGIQRLSVLAGAAGAALALRAWALSGLKASEGGAHVLDALRLVPWLLLDGLRALLLPTRGGVRLLSEEYADLGATHLLLGCLLIAALGALSWRLRRVAPEVGFGLLWAAGSLAPVALIASSGWWGFGRYLYLPAIGVGIALASLLRLLWTKREEARRPLALGLGAWLLLFAGLLFVTTRTWRTPEDLAHATIRANPDLSLGWQALAAWHAEHGDLADAARYAREAIDRNPRSRAAAILGSALLSEGRAAEARPLLERAARAQAYRLDLAYDLGLARLETGELEGAMAAAKHGQERFPDRADFFHLEALVRASGDPVASIDGTIAALQRQPEHVAARGLPAAILRSHPRAAAYRAALEQRLAAGVPPAVEAVFRDALAEVPGRSTIDP